MPDQTIVASPPAAGITEGTVTQAVAPTSQGAGQEQNAGTPQVEGGQPQASSEQTGRPRVSDFYREREERRSLRNMVQQLTTELQQMKSAMSTPAKAEPQKDPKAEDEKFFESPQSWTRETIKQMLDEQRREILEREVPGLLQSVRSQEEGTRNRQEAMEIIFPRSSSASGETLEERISRDPERAEKIMQILKDTGLDIVSQSNPIQAARTAMRLYELDNKSAAVQPVKPINPNAISKGAMGSTASGLPLGGQKKMPTLQEIKTQIDDLNSQVQTNPDLRFDDAWKQKWTALSGELSKLAKAEG